MPLAPLFLADETATARLGDDIAAALKPGDLVFLVGDLGAGKTSLARAIIRALADDAALDVPSPTFTLVQPYEARLPVLHVDLYRIGDATEVAELGLDDALRDGVALVEWPERGEGVLATPSLVVWLAEMDTGRQARIEGSEAMLERLARSFEIRAFLEVSGAFDATRRHLTGDASARAYETVATAGSKPRILMNSPRRPDGPPIRDGLPYSRIAHLAETVVPFVAINRALLDNGFAAPRIDAVDLDRGLLLIENLGVDGILDAERRPIADRYVATGELLADFHKRSWPREIAVAPGVMHHVPAYDRRALLIETELVLDWYFPFAVGREPTAAERQSFTAAWNAVLDGIADAEQSLVLRDYHSPNIIWREDRTGLDRIGLIDFQDAVFGPAAYDLASLAMDARVTIDPTLERRIVEAYLDARRAPDFDRNAFLRAYAVMAAQRNAKILGIFVRLDRRDGKPAYLRHLPRIRDYLGRALAHEVLGPVAAFFRDAGILDSAA